VLAVLMIYRLGLGLHRAGKGKGGKEGGNG